MTDAHAVVASYWAAADARDWQSFGGLLADDVVYEGPQTRERVRARDAYVRFNVEGFPGEWQHRGEANRRRRAVRGELDRLHRSARNPAFASSNSTAPV